MTARCPQCGQPVTPERTGVRMTELKARIFDIIRRAGPDGIDADDLFALIYAQDCDHVSRSTLKAHIHQITDRLEDSDVIIKGTRGAGRRFRLCRRRTS